MINTAIICLGSNTPDREMRIDNSCKKMADKAEIKRHSKIIISEDITGHGASYINQSIEITTNLTLAELRTFIHEIEQSEGRTPKSKAKGQMPIDIDIVIWNNEIISSENYTQPYFQALLTTLR